MTANTPTTVAFGGLFPRDGSSARSSSERSARLPVTAARSRLADPVIARARRALARSFSAAFSAPPPARTVRAPGAGELVKMIKGLAGPGDHACKRRCSEEDRDAGLRRDELSETT